DHDRDRDRDRDRDGDRNRDHDRDRDRDRDRNRDHDRDHTARHDRDRDDHGSRDRDSHSRRDRDDHGRDHQQSARHGDGVRNDRGSATKHDDFSKHVGSMASGNKNNASHYHVTTGNASHSSSPGHNSAGGRNRV